MSEPIVCALCWEYEVTDFRGYRMCRLCRNERMRVHRKKKRKETSDS